MGGFIAFALGAFPTEEMLRILRRLLSKYLNITENETSDQLVQLSGVTPEVAAVLAGEGIHAIQQLACMDPVALAVRSGLSFDYLLNLVYRFQRLFRTDNLSEDVARRLCPDEGLGVGVMVLEVVHDRALQFCDAFESAPADAFFGDLGKKALNQVEP